MLLGWSQRALAERASVAKRTLSLFETEQREPHQRTVQAIRDVLEAAGVEFSPPLDATGTPEEVRFSDGTYVRLVRRPTED